MVGGQSLDKVLVLVTRLTAQEMSSSTLHPVRQVGRLPTVARLRWNAGFGQRDQGCRCDGQELKLPDQSQPGAVLVNNRVLCLCFSFCQVGRRLSGFPKVGVVR